jgi:opacity protein-like surface antigen
VKIPIPSIKVLYFLTGALFASPLVLASEATNTKGNEGFYVGGALGLTHYDHDNFLDNGILSGSSFDDDGSGLKVIGGYQLNRWLSAEANYTYLGNYFESGSGWYDDDDIEVSISTFTASLLLHAPLGQWVTLYGQAGAGLAFISQRIDFDTVGIDIEEDESDTGLATQLGIGLTVQIPQVEGLQLRAGYEKHLFKTDLYTVTLANTLVEDEVDQTMDFLYLGATYHF